MRNPVVRIVVVLSVLTLIGVVALSAAGRHGIVTSKDGKMTFATKAPSHIVPDVPAAGTVIAGNLSRYPYGVYFCCYGYTISGPDSFLGSAYWVGVPFTPTSNTTVTGLKASVGWGQSGPNGVTLSLNADNSGVPGAALASANLSNLSDFGECCTVTFAHSSTGVAVTGGTQYWLVVSTSTATEDSFDAWSLNSTDMRSYPFATYSTANGWGATEGILPGYAVIAQ